MERLLRINGVDLAYSDVGEGRSAVLLIHGHPFNRSMWRPQTDHVSDRYRVVVPDLRGYGESSLPGDSRETRLETFAADSLALMDALALRTFVLGGLSMGGQIALEILRQAPGRIAALLLADTSADPDAPVVKRLRVATADRLEREGMDAYAREILPKMILPANAERLPGVAAHVMEMMTTTPPRGAAAALRGRARRRDYAPMLAGIAVPTLIVVGREDVYTPVATAERLHAGIPGSVLEVIEGAGHLPNLERAAAFNGVLARFLLSGPGDSP